MPHRLSLGATSGRYIWSISRPPSQMGPSRALVLVPTTIPGKGLRVPAPAKDLLRAWGKSTNASEPVSTSLQCGETLPYRFTSPGIIIMNKATASKMVHILNQGREFSIIQSVSFLAILLSDTKTYCFILWPAGTVSVQFLFPPAATLNTA